MQHKSQNKKTITILCVNLVNWPRIKNVLILVIKVIDCVCSETEVSHMWHCLFNKPELKGVWAQKKRKTKKKKQLHQRSIRVNFKIGQTAFLLWHKTGSLAPIHHPVQLVLWFQKTFDAELGQWAFLQNNMWTEVLHLIGKSSANRSPPSRNPFFRNNNYSMTWDSNLLWGGVRRSWCVQIEGCVWNKFVSDGGPGWATSTLSSVLLSPTAPSQSQQIYRPTCTDK